MTDAANPTVNPNPSSPPDAPKAKQVKARVLLDSHYGKCNEVVMLDAAAAKAGEEAGALDTNRAAVAYAESLRPAAAE